MSPFVEVSRTPALAFAMIGDLCQRRRSAKARNRRRRCGSVAGGGYGDLKIAVKVTV